MRSSLNARLLFSVSLLLLLFFGATIVVLDSAFRQSADQAEEDILDGQLMTLIATAELNADGNLDVPKDLPDPRFINIGSGLYAEIRDREGQSYWRSPSALNISWQGKEDTPAAFGAHVFTERTLPDGSQLVELSMPVEWETSDGQLAPYVFYVAEDLDSIHAQLSRFRRQLFTWFAAVAIIMLFAIGALLRRVLKPLRQIENEIEEIESGKRLKLSADLPTELEGVARNLNLLVGSERSRAERYRHTLDNLAHSLKTPLAAMRAVLNEGGSAKEVGARIDPQIERMNEIVRYQLGKSASVTGDHLGLVPIAVKGELTRLADAMTKVYRDKNPDISISADETIAVRLEKGDFLELAGNLIDNACKWCKTRVQVCVTTDTAGTIIFLFEDDGPGIPEESADRLLQRGMRLDESAPGQGIGLAVVRDIVNSYGGTLVITRSSLGGAKLAISLPPTARE